MSTDSKPFEDQPSQNTPEETTAQSAPEKSTVIETTRSEPTSETERSATSPRLAIGSQRDAAETSPVKPKAVESAIANPLQMNGETEQVGPAQEIKSTDGLSDDLDAEIEAMISDFSMDQIVESAQASETELEPRSRVEASVTKVHGENVFFQLAGQYEGVASLAHFKTPPEEGAILEVIIRDLNKEDGLYELSIPGSAVNVADWDDINEGDVVEAVVSGSNSGGLEAKVSNLDGFIPASQIDRFRVENFDDYIGKKLTCVAMEVNPDKRKLILSHRAVLDRENEAKRSALLETIEAGQLLEGTVTKLMDFGAFVDLGGLEGLIHISKLSWTRVKHPRDVLSEGQKVEVKVEKIDKATGKMSLSYRDTLDHPWDKIHEKFQPNDIVTGRVTNVAQFGAFVELEHGIEGLVHISEIDYKRVVAVKNYVSEGDQVEVKILSIDPANNKMSLSMKATQTPPKSAGQVAKEESEEDVPVRDQIVPKHEGPLKGGTNRNSGGDQFGLKW